jgi:hypothetical protein
MKWYDDLFLGASISKRRMRRMVRGVRTRSLWNYGYLLTLPANPDNLMDIISVQVVRQRAYPKRQLYVIGLAGSYREAQLLAGEILSSIYAVRGDFNLTEFIRQSREERSGWRAF